MRLTLKLLSSALLAMLMSACSDSSDPVDPSAPSDADMAYLTINVSSGSIGGSRADGDEYTDKDGHKYSFLEGISPYEQMRTLRVIIVRPNGIIEHNELLSTGLGSSFNASSTSYLKVVGGESKTVYLFANESYTYPYPQITDNLSEDLNSLNIGTEFSTKKFSNMVIASAAGIGSRALIDNSNPDLRSTYLPMSERFEITVDKLNDDASNRYQSADLFITRAAVKYGFYIDEEKAFKGDVKITEITINDIADREYLLPQITDGAEAPYEPEKYPVSNANRLITDYVCPADTRTFSYTFKPDNFGVTYQPTEGETSLNLKYEPAIYFPESPKREKYTISLTADFGKDSNGNSITKTYSDIELPNLPYLARNTFVKVYISFGESEITCKVDLVPYGEIILEPSFGIDHDDKNP